MIEPGSTQYQHELDKAMSKLKRKHATLASKAANNKQSVSSSSSYRQSRNSNSLSPSMRSQRGLRSHSEHVVGSGYRSPMLLGGNGKDRRERQKHKRRYKEEEHRKQERIKQSKQSK